MNGVFNLLKPPGPSSNDLVSDVKRLLRAHGFPATKVGHTGTLDPGAAGVLPICVGKATRLFDYLLNGEKEYLFEMRFGVATDTLDSYGSVVARDEKRISVEELTAVLPAFCGETRQIPPMYSALKLDGRKLYEIARKGLDDEAAIRAKKARVVTIHGIEWVEQTGDNRFLLRMRCTKGTYVRTVCEDVARALGTVATVSFLLRTRTGDFDLVDAITLDELSAAFEGGTAYDHLIPTDRALAAWPRVDAPDPCFDRLRNGNAIRMPVTETAGDGRVRVYCRGQFFGLGEWMGENLLLRCVLREPDAKDGSNDERMI